MNESNVRLVRYTFAERVMHAAAGLAFLYALLTGLALWTPALYWIAVALGGGFASRLLHPWAGLLFSVVMAWMFAMWHADMRTTDTDRLWRKALLKYIRNEDKDVPPAGRFNYGQKVFFWVMVWGTIALVVSGVVLWVPDAIPPAARSVREIAILMHAIASLVVIGAFIVHVYMGVAIVPGSVDAVLHGEVTGEWARQHHRLWVDEVANRPR